MPDISRSQHTSPPQSESVLQQTGRSFRELLAGLWNLTKFKQTLLLLITGACGYIISRPHSSNWHELALGMLALYAAISGCTVLNMVFDSDVDAAMARTAQRALPRGIIKMVEAVLFGSLLSYFGLWLAWQLKPVFGMVVAAGFIIDLCIYTLWLKRLTPYSIIWGGISGGMPALAGRALACGCIDLTGLLFALSVLFWIPTHILTLVLRHAGDYEKVKIPVWPNCFGSAATRRFIAVATLCNAVVFSACGLLLEIRNWALGALVAMSLAITAIAVWCAVSPRERHDFVLFKAASLYMLLAFVLIAVGAFLA
jgi:protoheme IX farnesyltransferase